jgi:hypothetical protein
VINPLRNDSRSPGVVSSKRAHAVPMPAMTAAVEAAIARHVRAANASELQVAEVPAKRNSSPPLRATTAWLSAAVSVA